MRDESDPSPTILCAVQFVPAADGVGAEQRAWHLVRALSGIGRVHLVVLGPLISDAGRPERRRRIAGHVETLTVLEPPRSLARHLPRRASAWLELLGRSTPGSARFDACHLDAALARVPLGQVDVAFAGRLATIPFLDALAARGLIAPRRRVVDFDDVGSRFVRSEIATLSRRQADRRLRKRIEAARLARAERRALAAWDAVSVCGRADAEALLATAPAASIHVVPNVVERPLLGPSRGAVPTVLFVGNLSFAPNAEGLLRFLDEAWPRVRRERADARLLVVGRDPPPRLRERLRGAGVALHADVASVEPFYAAADVVVAPVFYGSGTRIKLLEAMAHGRAIVATTPGAAGLDLVPGEHALIADDLAAFADGVVRLLGDPAARKALAAQARALQEARFGSATMRAAVCRMVLWEDAEDASG